jgi:hypothetical protein
MLAASSVLAMLAGAHQAMQQEAAPKQQLQQVYWWSRCAIIAGLFVVAYSW